MTETWWHEEINSQILETKQPSWALYSFVYLKLKKNNNRGRRRHRHRRRIEHSQVSRQLGQNSLGKCGPAAHDRLCNKRTGQSQVRDGEWFLAIEQQVMKNEITVGLDPSQLGRLKKSFMCYRSNCFLQQSQQQITQECRCVSLSSSVAVGQQEYQETGMPDSHRASVVLIVYLLFRRSS